MEKEKLDLLSINTIRFLAIDAVEKAKSGHAGTPMGAAPVIYTLWNRFLKHSPSNPDWVDRDRFVLSSGHASMMLYAILYLSGYNISLDDLKNFRQLNSLAPGHPEFRHTPGVETTTGPLGQGFANAVGMAMAEAHLASRFNRPDAKIVDHYTYVLVSDGDLMEGVASEAASLAGHLRLGKLICFYDDNRVTIEGSTDLAFTEDRVARFRSYGWHVQQLNDGNDLNNVSEAIKNAQETPDKPSLIAIHSLIGFGSPNKQGKSVAHSGALGADELRLTKKNLNWPYEESFFVPPEVRRHLGKAVDKGNTLVSDWTHQFEKYKAKYPDEANEFSRIMSRELPTNWEDHLPIFEPESGKMSTRKANTPIINKLSQVIPEFMGGSADLAPSNVTKIENSENFAPESYHGRVLHFGVREHAMGSILNGMTAHGGVRPYGATYLTFYDYMRPAVRLSAMMKLPVIYIFTHDSIAVGEDGPTHQPIEQLIGLRSVPNITVIRPCDANEACEAWRVAISNTKGPTCLILSRQDLPILDRQKYALAKNLERGAYIISDPQRRNPELLLVGTGAEVHLALEAQLKLADLDIHARVVSMPSWELFNAQSASYKQSIFPDTIKARIAIEAGSAIGWERWVGDQGEIIGIDHFGISAPANELFKLFGFTVDNVVNTALKLLRE